MQKKIPARILHFVYIFGSGAKSQIRENVGSLKMYFAFYHRYHDVTTEGGKESPRRILDGKISHFCVKYANYFPLTSSSVVAGVVVVIAAVAVVT